MYPKWREQVDVAFAKKQLEEYNTNRILKLNQSTSQQSHDTDIFQTQTNPLKKSEPIKLTEQKITDTVYSSPSHNFRPNIKNHSTPKVINLHQRNMKTENFVHSPGNKIL